MYCLTIATILRKFSRPRKQKKQSKEQAAAAAAGFGAAKAEDTIPVNTGTPLKGRRGDAK